MQVQVMHRDVNFVRFDLHGQPLSAHKNGNYLGYKPRVQQVDGRYELLTKHEYGTRTYLFYHDLDGLRQATSLELSFDDYRTIDSNDEGKMVYIAERGERRAFYIDDLGDGTIYPFYLEGVSQFDESGFVISKPLKEVQFIDAVRGRDHYGVVMVASDDQGEGVFFTTVDPESHQRGVLRRLSALGVDVNQRAQVRWTGVEWVVIWGEAQAGYQMVKGQLQCP